MDGTLAHRALNLTLPQFKVAARHLTGSKQADIARDLNIKQAAVSRLLGRARRRNPDLFERLRGSEATGQRRGRRVKQLSQLPPERLAVFTERLGLT